MISRFIVKDLLSNAVKSGERNVLQSFCQSQVIIGRFSQRFFGTFSNANRLNRFMTPKQAKSTMVSNIRRLTSQTPKPNSKNEIIKKSFISWRSATVVLIFAGALVIFMYKLQEEKEASLKKQRKQAIGKMAIGGDFELVDQNGKLRKNQDFLGQWMLIYFGFTRCPDICPDELEKMCRAVDLIEKVQVKDAKILPVFITVDPSRDDVQTVAKYIKDFSPKLIGLTGNSKQIEQVTRAYRVYYSAGPKDEDQDYIVDHTVIMYLVDPEGNFVDYYGQNKKAEEIASAIALHMASFQVGANKKNEKEEKK